MHQTRRLAVISAVLAMLWVLSGVSTAGASTSTITYTATVTVPVPPASSFSGSTGGDGWALAMTPTAVYNVFHHDPQLQVACHLQSNASGCAGYPKTITDSKGNGFASASQPGLWLDQANGHLFVFATRVVDNTGGVVCIDTTQPATKADPFCGFTALTAVGQAPILGSISAISDPVVVGTNWYAFNFVSGAATTGTENRMLCFSLTTLTACPAQPYAVNLGSGTVTSFDFPDPSIAAIGNQVIVPATTSSDPEGELGCLNATTNGACSGTWPVTLNDSYPSSAGAPFPMLSSTGSVIGLCLPTGLDPCFTLKGATAATPATMPTAVPRSSGWNGPALTIGARVYVPNGFQEEGGAVYCYDYSTNAECTNFPKVLPNIILLYTVNPDPQRPSCIWVNSDDDGGGGSVQVVNFDAFTGGPCGQGAIRVLAASVVAPDPACVPGSWKSLQVESPARSGYTSGSVSFEDGDANPLPGVPAQSLDNTGSVDLSHLNLATKVGLPQFLITLNGTKGTPGQVVVKLVWTGAQNAACLQSGTSGQEPPPPPPPAALGDGMMLLGGDGGMFAYGDRGFINAANFLGRPGPLTTPNGQVITATFTGLASTPDRKGYWDVTANGGVYTVGDAPYLGGLTSLRLSSPIAGIAGRPDGKGYWLVGRDGGVFAFGDAPYLGSMAGKHLAAPIVRIVSTTDGNGYWLVGSDGGVFAFGDARFYGSLIGEHLADSIVDMVATHDGRGYLMTGRDGGVFAFGDAHFYGSQAGQTLPAPVVAIGLSRDGLGYWLIGADGSVFNHGDAPIEIPTYRGKTGPLTDIKDGPFRAPIVDGVA